MHFLSLPTGIPSLQFKSINKQVWRTRWSYRGNSPSCLFILFFFLSDLFLNKDEDERLIYNLFKNSPIQNSGSFPAFFYSIYYQYNIFNTIFIHFLPDFLNTAPPLLSISIISWYTKYTFILLFITWTLLLDSLSASKHSESFFSSIITIITQISSSFLHCSWMGSFVEQLVVIPTKELASCST